MPFALTIAVFIIFFNILMWVVFFKKFNAFFSTDKIIEEIFNSFGFRLKESIAHKLKTNNSNSQVPWQDRIIENEYVMLFQKGTECV